MKYRIITHCFVVLLLSCGTISAVEAQSRSRTFEEQIELDDFEGIKYGLPIEVKVKTGDQYTLTVTGTQLLHDALLVTIERDEISIDLDLVVLCPDSKQEFIKEEHFPSRLHKSYSFYKKLGRPWRMEFGRDCVVDSKVLGFPTLELTTPSLAWIGVARLGRLRIDEMIENQIRLEIGGSARTDIGRIEGKDIQITVSGSSDLRVKSLESNVTKISLSGLSDLGLGTLESSLVEISQSGSTESETTSLETNRLLLTIKGLSDCDIGKVFGSGGPSPTEDVAMSSIDVSGSTDVNIKQIQLPQLDLAVSGLSDLEIGRITTDHLNLSATGSSGVSMKQVTTDTSQIESSGLADIEIVALESNSAEIHASGTSDVAVRKAKVDELDVQSTGISDVTVKGKKW